MSSAQWRVDLGNRLVAAGVREAHFSFSVSESFNRRNQGASVGESFAAAASIIGRARWDGISVTVTLSTAFACPFASLGGIGGCPFAPRATGNIATEDLVYLRDGEGIETGVDLDALIDTALWLERVLGNELEGQVYRAGRFPPLL